MKGQKEVVAEAILDFYVSSHSNKLLVKAI